MLRAGTGAGKKANLEPAGAGKLIRQNAHTLAGDDGLQRDQLGEPVGGRRGRHKDRLSSRPLPAGELPVRALDDNGTCIAGCWRECMQ